MMNGDGVAIALHMMNGDGVAIVLHMRNGDGVAIALHMMNGDGVASSAHEEWGWGSYSSAHEEWGWGSYSSAHEEWGWGIAIALHMRNAWGWGRTQAHLAALDVCFSSPARTGGSGTLLVVSLFWIVRFSYTTILLTLYENRTIQNKLTTTSLPDPPVRAGDEKHTSSAARWVWARD